VDSASEIGASAPSAEPTPEAAPEAAPVQTAAAQTDSIPKFLATECASLEVEQPDSLIPFRTALAACALVAAVVLIYFWSSQEFGLAARTIAGTSGVSESRVLAPEIPPSVAVRQAFVAAPPAYSAASEPVRVYRPPFVGFDFLDESGAPPAAAKTEMEPEPAPSQAALVVPQSSAEETAALPPSPSSDLAALIKRGDALLKAGDIAAARSAYERAAAGGNAKAQIGVAKTYDPLVLAKLKTRGVRGDPVQAASWYARASEAGDEEGQQRLQALIAGLSDCMLSQGACAPRKP
jgi:TPR repeat protein